VHYKVTLAVISLFFCLSLRFLFLFHRFAARDASSPLSLFRSNRSSSSTLTQRVSLLSSISEMKTRCSLSTSTITLSLSLNYPQFVLLPIPPLNCGSCFVTYAPWCSSFFQNPTVFVGWCHLSIISLLRLNVDCKCCSAFFVLVSAHSMEERMKRVMKFSLPLFVDDISLFKTTRALYL
jgi:hypothetical protein